MEPIERELGKFEAQIENLEKDVKNLYRLVESMQGQLTRIETTMSEAKGGWKILAWLAGLVGAVGGSTVAVIMSWLLKKGG